MPFEHKNNSASLFRNDRRESDNHPTHTGSGKVDGVEYWISAWVNETSAGKKFFSIKLDPKENRPRASQPVDSTDFDDDVPF